MPTQVHPRLAKELLGYYVKHPKAADTAEGLARWRLLAEYVERTVRETEEALEWLVTRGFLRQEPMSGGRPVFVLNAERQLEAKEFLDAKEDYVGER
jgi:hypothetical protein